MRRIQLPLHPNDILKLKSGDIVLINGKVHTARDAAHARMKQLLEDRQPLAIRIDAIYYTGPCPAPKGKIIGSCGPTTSGRMDPYTPLLLENGLKVMIGKGDRSDEVVNSIIKHKAVYFAAVGGAGALLSKCVTSSRVVAFDDLGTEAIHELTLCDFPVIVAVDAYGNNIYRIKIGG